MPYLRFNPYYALPAYSTVEDGPEFPFKEGERVTMQLRFGIPIMVTEDRRTEADLRNIGAKLEVELFPIGKEIDGYILSEVQRIVGEPRSHTLRFLMVGLENVLQAVITAEDKETEFPFEPSQIVIVPLIVERVKRCPPTISSNNLWQALLSPSGSEVNGLIVARVELAKE